MSDLVLGRRGKSYQTQETLDPPRRASPWVVSRSPGH